VEVYLPSATSLASYLLTLRLLSGDCQSIRHQPLVDCPPTLLQRWEVFQPQAVWLQPPVV
jgi:hypothetical protein